MADEKAPEIPVMPPIHTVQGGDEDGMVAVMEIDPADPEDKQAQERAQAMMAGIPVVMKGQVKEPGVAPEKKAAATAKADSDSDDADAHPLLGSKGGNDEEGASPSALPAPPKEVMDYFASAGIEGIEDVVQNLPTIVARNAELEAQYEQAEQRLALLNDLSPDAKNIIAMDLAREDWKSKAIAKPGIDMSKPWSKQGDLRKVMAAYGEEVSDEDWADYEDEDGDPRVKRIIGKQVEAAKKAFEADREEANTFMQRQSDEANARHEAHVKSAKRALQVVRSVPGSAAHIERVQEKLTREGILGLFFEEDGVTWKPDAGVNAWLLLDRKAILGAMEEQISRKARTEATVRQLRRTDERPAKGSKGSGAEQMTAEQVAKALFLQGMGRR